jgi:hypothetical protein
LLSHPIAYLKLSQIPVVIIGMVTWVEIIAVRVSAARPDGYTHNFLRFQSLAEV